MKVLFEFIFFPSAILYVNICANNLVRSVFGDLVAA